MPPSLPRADEDAGAQDNASAVDADMSDMSDLEGMDVDAHWGGETDTEDTMCALAALFHAPY